MQSLLNPSQQRHIFISLLSFEKSLRTAKRLLAEPDESGFFYQRKTRLSPELRQQLQNKVSEALDALGILAEQFQFEPAAENLESIIKAEMSVSWINLEECRSKRMRGYGKLDPRAAEMLDPIVNHLARLALEISLLTNSTPPEEDNLIES